MRRWTTMMCLGFVLTSGCTTTYDPYYYDTAYYDPYWYGYDAAWAYTWVDPYGVTYFARAPTTTATQTTSLSLPSIAAGIAGVAERELSPAGCAGALVDGETVTITLTDCTGPNGPTSVSGNMTIAVSENSDGQLVLTSTSQDLTVDDLPVIIDSVATVTESGDRREVMIVSHTRAPDRVDSRDAQLTAIWEQGSGCFSVEGEASTQRDDKSTTSTLEGYQRCIGECPTQGTITVIAEGDEFTATFDGSDQLVVNLPDGDTRTFDLECE